jgi:4-amino-4-deoxy-L-arabinose transferase-like glycosyltransferase
MGPGGRVDAALIEYLEANRGSADYLVAVNSSMAASPIILQTGAPVMAMGGFSGGDPAPTAGQLARMVADGKLRFVMGGGRMGGGPGRGPGGGVAGERAAWVEANCQAVDPSAYGEPRDAGDQSAQVGRGFGRGGEQQLFDCAPGLAAVTDQPGG